MLYTISRAIELSHVYFEELLAWDSANHEHQSFDDIYSRGISGKSLEATQRLMAMGLNYMAAHVNNSQDSVGLSALGNADKMYDALNFFAIQSRRRSNSACRSAIIEMTLQSYSKPYLQQRMSHYIWTLIGAKT